MKLLNEHFWSCTQETSTKTPERRGICEYCLGQKVLQILLQIRAFQNSVLELRNPNIHIKNTVSSCSRTGTWGALGLVSPILLEQVTRTIQMCHYLKGIRNQSRCTLRLYQQLPFWARRCEKLVLKIFLRLFSLCTRIAEVLSEVLSPPQVTAKLKEAAGAPCHRRSHHWLNHQQSLITKTCSWYPVKSEIAVRVPSN